MDRRNKREVEKLKERQEVRRRDLNESIDAIDRAHPDDIGQRVLEKARARLDASDDTAIRARPPYAGPDRRGK
jgi:hypothetical protein